MIRSRVFRRAPQVASASLQQAFEAEARQQGFDPHDPWVGGYAVYEWDRLRHVLDAHDVNIEGAAVLEFGCNVGASAVVLHALGGRVTGIETDPRPLAVARANAARYGAADIRFVQGRPDDRMPFESASFDVIVCNSVLEYVPSPRLPRVVAELVRVLKPGGRLVILGSSSRLWPREMHSGRWLANYLPRGVDRFTGRELQRGLWPWHLRRLFGPSFHNLDLDDGGRAWLRARAAFHGGAPPYSARFLQWIARGMRVGPGWLTNSLSAVLVKRQRP